MKRLPSEDRAGLWITAIVHLAVIIVLLAVQIGFSVRKENTFILDFSAQEEQEKLEDMIAAASAGVPVRNLTVNLSSRLKDDRNTDAEKLYQDAERLARELKDGQNQKPDDPDDYVEVPGSRQDDKPTVKKAYSGPSVLSWSLDGRNASRLPIPAYRCMGAGVVTVIIAVNNNGDVLNAKIEDGSSSQDGCLRSFAVQAARLSKFSASGTAPARQMGTITYAFIAQ